MQTVIKIRRGQKAQLPAPNTQVGELRYAQDTKELFIDDGAQNVLLNPPTDTSPFEEKANKGQNNGYASLDNNGKVPLTQLSDAVLGNLQFQDSFDATTGKAGGGANLPAANAAKGKYWICNVAGTFSTIPFDVGDWLVSNGTGWNKIDNTDAVASVNGKLGVVVLNKSDVGLSDVDNVKQAPNTHVGSTGVAQHGLATGSVAGFSEANFSQPEKTKLAGLTTPPTVASTSKVLKGDGAGNAVAVAATAAQAILGDGSGVDLTVIDGGTF
jgi:hypothetical protein